MRITFILPELSLAGGMRVAAIYAHRLMLRGHHVQVVAPPHRSPRLKKRVAHFLQGNGWLTGIRVAASHFDATPVPRIILDRARPVRDADVPPADVVIATWWKTAEWVACLDPVKGVKVYFMQHDERLMAPPASRLRIAATARLPMHKITISPWLVDLARTDYGDPDASLVPNSVDTGQFFAPPRSRQNRPTVGILYASPPIKGFDITLKALARVRTALPDLAVLAFGAEEPSRKLPLPPGTEFHLRPPQEAIRDLYARCDLWLCGSRSEGFHLPPLEAMACRCPVVSTRVGGAIETIQDGINGYLTDIADDKALADAVIRLLRMPEEQWQQMSAAAHARAHLYTWEDATALFEMRLKCAIARHI